MAMIFSTEGSVGEGSAWKTTGCVDPIFDDGQSGLMNKTGLVLAQQYNYRLGGSVQGAGSNYYMWGFSSDIDSIVDPSGLQVKVSGIWRSPVDSIIGGLGYGDATLAADYGMNIDGVVFLNGLPIAEGQWGPADS
jgi:hypothetical protein